MLDLLAAGRTLGEAAGQLHLARRSADRRLAAARTRLGVATTSAAVRARAARLAALPRPVPRLSFLRKPTGPATVSDMQDRTPRPEDLDPIERASVDELRALQLERLQWSLHHAYENVPHYRAAFEAAGVHPDDCTQLADLARFPFTTKADLRENYPFGMFAVPREQVSRIHASSGTTGRPTVVGYTAEDIRTWAAVMARSIRAERRPAG